MEKILSAITISILTFGCTVCSQEPGLKQYVKDLRRLIDFQENNVCDITYGDPGSGSVGVARTADFLYCDITIIPNLTEYRQRATAYHEIFHCIGGDHTSESGEIMSVRISSETYLRNNWPKLEREFVSQIRDFL
jgi:hypothetical protein